MDEKVSLGLSPQQSQAQPMPATATPQPGEYGYVPPSEVVPLPSLGKLYPANFPYHNTDVVEIRSMTTKDEDILSSRALLKQGKAIGYLINSCLVDKTVDPDLLITGDKNAITVAIRITGYGSLYDPEVECPKCDEKSKPNPAFDLSKMEIKRLGAEPVSLGENMFSYTFPVCKKEVLFKLLNGKDEKELSLILERQKKTNGPDVVESAVTSRLLMQILSIGGETDRSKLSAIIRNLTPYDSRSLTSYISKVEPGINMNQSFTCHSCGTTSEVEVPMTVQFFWPTI